MSLAMIAGISKEMAETYGTPGPAGPQGEPGMIGDVMVGQGLWKEGDTLNVGFGPGFNATPFYEHPIGGVPWVKIPGGLGLPGTDIRWQFELDRVIRVFPYGTMEELFLTSITAYEYEDEMTKIYFDNELPEEVEQFAVNIIEYGRILLRFASTRKPYLAFDQGDNIEEDRFNRGLYVTDIERIEYEAYKGTANSEYNNQIVGAQSILFQPDALSGLQFGMGQIPMFVLPAIAADTTNQLTNPTLHPLAGLLLLNPMMQPVGMPLKIGNETYTITGCKAFATPGWGMRIFQKNLNPDGTATPVRFGIPINEPLDIFYQGNKVGEYYDREADGETVLPPTYMFTDIRPFFGMSITIEGVEYEIRDTNLQLAEITLDRNISEEINEGTFALAPLDEKVPGLSIKLAPDSGLELTPDGLKATGGSGSSILSGNGIEVLGSREGFSGNVYQFWIHGTNDLGLGEPAGIAFDFFPEVLDAVGVITTNTEISISGVTGSEGAPGLALNGYSAKPLFAQVFDVAGTDYFRVILPHIVGVSDQPGFLVGINQYDPLTPESAPSGIVTLDAGVEVSIKLAEDSGLGFDNAGGLKVTSTPVNSLMDTVERIGYGVELSDEPNLIATIDQTPIVVEGTETSTIVGVSNYSNNEGTNYTKEFDLVQELLDDVNLNAFIDGSSEAGAILSNAGEALPDCSGKIYTLVVSGITGANSNSLNGSFTVVPIKYTDVELVWYYFVVVEQVNGEWHTVTDLSEVVSYAYNSPELANAQYRIYSDSELVLSIKLAEVNSGLEFVNGGLKVTTIPVESLLDTVEEAGDGIRVGQPIVNSVATDFCAPIGRHPEEPSGVIMESIGSVGDILTSGLNFNDKSNLLKSLPYDDTVVTRSDINIPVTVTDDKIFDITITDSNSANLDGSYKAYMYKSTPQDTEVYIYLINQETRQYISVGIEPGQSRSELNTTATIVITYGVTKIQTKLGEGLTYDENGNVIIDQTWLTNFIDSIVNP